jgi:hypothetical protein
VPVAPLVTVIQLVVVVAVHEHDVPVMTLSVWVEAVAPTVKLVGVRLYEHCASANDTSAAQSSATSPQKRAVFMVVSSTVARVGEPVHRSGRRDRSINR